jgi:O-antigen ligase
VTENRTADSRVALVTRGSRPSAERRTAVKSRRAAVLVLPCAALLYLSLGLDWYHYKSDGGHEFDSDASIVFTGLDTYLTVVAIASVVLAVVALAWSRVLAGVALGVLSAIAIEQITYRLIEQPYAEKFVSVTPQLGALLGLASAAGLFVLSVLIYPYPRMAIDAVADLRRRVNARSLGADPTPPAPTPRPRPPDRRRTR